MYAKKIADEGFRAKGEELVRELFGPVFWYVKLLLLLLLVLHGRDFGVFGLLT